MPEVTIKSCIAHATRVLKSRSSTARLDAELILSHIIGKESSFFWTHPDAVLTAEQQLQFEGAIKRRATGEPVAYIIGTKDFWTLELLVTEDTLIPRPETELIIELALSYDLPKNASVLDLGTGSGAIALALAKENPGWDLLAVDDSEKAIAVAKENAKRNRVDNIGWLIHHWADDVDVSFDLVVSNPPYIDISEQEITSGSLKFEPHHALIADDNGFLDLKYIATQVWSLLKPGGRLVMEHGFSQAERLNKLYLETGYVDVKTHPDLAGLDRVTVGVKE